MVANLGCQLAEFKLTLDGGWERKRGGELRESMERWEKKGKQMYTNAHKCQY